MFFWGIVMIEESSAFTRIGDFGMVWAKGFGTYWEFLGNLVTCI